MVKHSTCEHGYATRDGRCNAPECRVFSPGRFCRVLWQQGFRGAKLPRAYKCQFRDKPGHEQCLHDHEIWKHKLFNDRLKHAAIKQRRAVPPLARSTPPIPATPSSQRHNDYDFDPIALIRGCAERDFAFPENKLEPLFPESFLVPETYADTDPLSTRERFESTIIGQLTPERPAELFFVDTPTRRVGFKPSGCALESVH